MHKQTMSLKCMSYSPATIKIDELVLTAQIQVSRLASTKASQPISLNFMMGSYLLRLGGRLFHLQSFLLLTGLLQIRVPRPGFSVLPVKLL